MIAREGAKMLLQLSNRLQLSPEQLVHRPLLFILPGFPYGLFLLMLNLPPLSPLFAVNKSLKIGESLLNRVNTCREIVEVITYTSISLSKTRNLHFEGGQGLEEGRVKRHVHRRGRRPVGLMGK